MNAFKKVVFVFAIMVVGVVIAGFVLGDQKIVNFERNFLQNTEFSHLIPEQKVEYNYNKPKYLVEKTISVDPNESLGYKNYSFMNDDINIKYCAPKDFTLNNTEKSLEKENTTIYTYVEPIPEKYDTSYSYESFVKDYLASKYTQGEKTMISGKIDTSSFYDEKNNTTYYYFTVPLNDDTTNYFFVTTCDNNIVSLQYKIKNSEKVDIKEIEAIFLSVAINKETK